MSGGIGCPAMKIYQTDLERTLNLIQGAKSMPSKRGSMKLDLTRVAEIAA